ncbi:Imm7 family immunity protein [Actinokineospora sp.]|uniref:Imm7 family immunity protein n=1 Tax=Actinokineospora sp. TaxID=1872133 RepID=UPI0040380444
MHEFHGWFGLSETTEEADIGGLQNVVNEIRQLLTPHELAPMSMSWSLEPLNGQYFLIVTGNPNRRRTELALLDRALELIRDRLPGSWGLLYERDDELPVPPGPNSYQVRVLARGQFSVHLDPFLSPCNPTIED